MTTGISDGQVCIAYVGNLTFSDFFAGRAMRIQYKKKPPGLHLHVLEAYSLDFLCENTP